MGGQHGNKMLSCTQHSITTSKMLKVTNTKLCKPTILLSKLCLLGPQPYCMGYSHYAPSLTLSADWQHGPPFLQPSTPPLSCSLVSRRLQWKKAEEERLANRPDPSVPPGHSLMSNKERRHTLDVLTHR